MSTVNDLPPVFEPLNIADYFFIVRAESGLPASAGAEKLLALEGLYEWLRAQVLTPIAGETNNASGNVSINAFFDIYTVNMGGNVTLQNPSGPLQDGRVMRIRVKQRPAGGATVTLGNNYRAPSSMSITWPTNANESAIMTIIYNLTDLKWDILGFESGYV